MRKARAREFPASPSRSTRRGFALVARECLRGFDAERRREVWLRLGHLLGSRFWTWDERRGPFCLTEEDRALVKATLTNPLLAPRSPGESRRHFLDRRAWVESQEPETVARWGQEETDAFRLRPELEDDLASGSRAVVWRWKREREEIDTAVYVLLVRARDVYRGRLNEPVPSAVPMRDALAKAKRLAGRLTGRTQAGREKRLARLVRFLSPESRKPLREALGQSWRERDPAVLDGGGRLVPHPLKAMQCVLRGERLEEWESPVDWTMLVHQTVDALDAISVENVRRGDPKRRRAGLAVRELVWIVCDLVWALGEPVTSSLPGRARGRSSGRRGGARVGRLARTLMSGLGRRLCSQALLSSAVKEWHHRHQVEKVPAPARVEAR